MAYEMKNNSGSLFKNDKKETEKHPDYKGSAKVNGDEYWVSAWLNKSKEGTQYLSFNFEIKDVQPSIQKEAGVEADTSFIPF
jgi:uncharacterized protein (DUF736 family)